MKPPALVWSMHPRHRFSNQRSVRVEDANPTAYQKSINIFIIFEPTQFLTQNERLSNEYW